MSSKHRNRSRSRQKQRSRSPSPHRQQSRHSHKDQKQHKHRDSRNDQQKVYEQTKVICIEDCNENNLKKLQQIMTDTSISIGTSVPDEVQIKENTAYIKYPSIEVATSIYNYMKGAIRLDGKEYQLKYWPIKKSDVNILYDWYCDKCEYKNFAKRGRCHRCDNEKNPNCRLNYNNQFFSVNNPSKKEEIDDAVNCSLMIRGPIITEIQEEILLNIFEGFAPIKDIRTIRNKLSGGNRDFAFIQFFTPEEAAFALKKANTPQFRIGNQKVTVMYSKTKQDDEYFSRPYDKDRRGPPRRQTKVTQDTPNYYLRQRQLEIEEQKKRPLVTLQQLKEKREIQLKKSLPQQKQMSEQQNQRRKAEMLAKQWEKEMKTQMSEIFVCVLCKRKFKNEEEMNNHAQLSELHKYKMARLDKELLAL